jgi:hypothetical protein
VSEPTPSFEEIRRLVTSRKPPLAARVVDRRDGEVMREASVVFDGINAWFIDDGSRIELRAAEDRVVYVEEGSIERIGPGMVAASNAWVKTALDGRRMAFDQAEGEVLGRDDVAGRRCWLVRVDGLKRNDPATFLLHVDAETGVVMRTAREEADVVLDVEELMLGSVTERDREAGLEP